MFKYNKKIIAAIAAACAAAALTTACGNDKTEELSSSSSSVAGGLEEIAAESETKEKTTAPKETEATTEAATAQTTAKVTTESETTPATGVLTTETPTEATTEKSVSVIIDPNMGQEQNTQATAAVSPSYNQDVYEKLGIQVVLSGTNEQQAQQYVDACKAAYPSLPWACTGTWAGIDVSVIQSSSTIDVWSMAEEEVTAMLNERLDGRDYHDMSIEELYSLMDIAHGCSYGIEIYDYLMSLTSRDFNSGGYVALW